MNHRFDAIDAIYPFKLTIQLIDALMEYGA
jgi:hypothetical protein